MKSCATCIYVERASCECARLQTKVDLQADICPFYSNVPYICAVCNRIGSAEDIFIDSKTNKYLCGDCLAAASTCKLCANATSCDFESNPSPLPKVVMQNIRQGNMMIQTQVRNPERVKITCANGCICYQNSVCMRQMGSCGNHKCIFDKE